MQALQGLPGYRGTENGIGIGLGLQQLAQARAQQQLNAHKAALASNGLISGHVRGLQPGYCSSKPGHVSIDQAGQGVSCSIGCCMKDDMVTLMMPAATFLSLHYSQQSPAHLCSVSVMDACPSKYHAAARYAACFH